MEKENQKKKVEVIVDSKNNFTISCEQKLSNEEKKEVKIQTENMLKDLARLDSNRTPEVLDKLAEDKFNSESSKGFFGLKESKINFNGKKLTKEEFKKEFLEIMTPPKELKTTITLYV